MPAISSLNRIQNMETKVPNKYVGRIWVDVEFTAENVVEAKQILSALTHDVGWEKFPVDAEIYEVQAEHIWTENGEYIS